MTDIDQTGLSADMTKLLGDFQEFVRSPFMTWIMEYVTVQLQASRDMTRFGIQTTKTIEQIGTDALKQGVRDEHMESLYDGRFFLACFNYAQSRLKERHTHSAAMADLAAQAAAGPSGHVDAARKSLFAALGIMGPGHDR